LRPKLGVNARFEFQPVLNRRDLNGNGGSKARRAALQISARSRANLDNRNFLLRIFFSGADAYPT